MLRHVIGATVLVLGGLAAGAATAEDFYKGKTVTIVTSTGPGGGYDLTARAIARNMGNFLPGKPGVIVQNMPGGGNVLATNYMYNIAPKDGTVIATINNAMPLHQALKGKGVRFDARQFNWLGSTGSSNEVVFVWHSTGVRSVDDLKKTQVVLGGTGPASSIVIFPTAMNNILGTKFKIVTGYKSSSEIDVVLERGEVLARSNSYASLVSKRPQWLSEKKVNILVQVGAKRDKALPDVPLLSELATNDLDRQTLQLISSPILMGRPYLAPPRTGADRVAALRKAFQGTMDDKAFQGEIKRLNLDLDPFGGDEVSRVVNDTINAPEEIIAKAIAAMPKGGAKKKKKKS